MPNRYQPMFAFTNLLEIATIIAPGGNVYETQDRLVEECRESGTRFLAIIPERHQVECPVCHVRTGDALLHFEDPAQAPDAANDGLEWRSSTGRYVETRRSVLHVSVAHGLPMPDGLQELFDLVTT